MLIGIAFYVPIYTIWLKRRSQWNVVIGGTAGSFATIAGWTAAGGNLSLLPLCIGFLGLLWTPDHLWALAIQREKEYAGVHIPMLPITAGVKIAAKQILYWNSAIVGFSFLIPFFGITGKLYAAVALIAGLLFLAES